jgi:hypothetical protein
MANPNPHAARMAKKRARKPGNLPQLLRMLWHALLEAQAVLDTATADEAELKLRAVHALSQASRQYAKLLEIGELEAQLSALEQQMQGGP